MRVPLIVLILGIVIGASAVCEFSKGEFYSRNEVLQCFKLMSLSDDIKYTTLETLKRSLELYSFYDIAIQSPDPNLPLHVDMRNALEKIANTQYSHDFDFHNEIRSLFTSLNDAHTQYYAPTSYQSMRIRQGFAPVAVGDSTRNFQIKVSPYFPDDLVDWYYDHLNVYLPDFTGYTIVSVNNEPAFDYFLNYANTSVGMVKDLGARFNYAMTLPEPRDDKTVIIYGYWQQRTGRNPFPDTDSVTYNLLSPSGKSVSLILPWTFKALTSYSGFEEWLEDYYDGARGTQTERSFIRPDNFDRYQMELGSHYNLLHKKGILNKDFKTSPDETFELLVNTEHLSFWQLSDNKTLVMYLDSMAPGKLSGYYPALLKGFEAAADRNLTRLIIDLSNNGGGNICLGRTLLAFLQKDGWEGQGQNWGAEDLPLSPLAETLIRSAVDNNIENTIWSPAFYDDQRNQPISNNDTNLFLPGVPHVRGGKLRNYSKLIHIDGCGDPGYSLNPAVNFSPNEMLIITNGFCGSTCALFSNHLSLYDDVKTVVLGGIPDKREMQYSAFPGGQVLDNGPLFSQLVRLKQDVSFVPYLEIDPNDVVPRRLATTASFRYCIREIYPPARDQFPYGTNPIEFTFQEATYHLYHNDKTAVYPQYAWYEALPFYSA